MRFFIFMFFVFLFLYKSFFINGNFDVMSHLVITALICLFATPHAKLNAFCYFFTLLSVFLFDAAKWSTVGGGIGAIALTVYTFAIMIIFFILNSVKCLVFDRKKQVFSMNENYLNYVSLWCALCLCLSYFLIMRHIIQPIGTYGIFVYIAISLLSALYFYRAQGFIKIVSWKTMWHRVVQYQAIMSIVIVVLNLLTPFYVIKKASDFSGGKPYCTIVYSAPGRLANWIDLNFLTMTQHTFSFKLINPHATVSYRGDDGMLETGIWSYSHHKFMIVSAAGLDPNFRIGEKFSNDVIDSYRECDPATGIIQMKLPLKKQRVDAGLHALHKNPKI